MFERFSLRCFIITLPQILTVDHPTGGGGGGGGCHLDKCITSLQFLLVFTSRLTE